MKIIILTVLLTTGCTASQVQQVIGQAINDKLRDDSPETRCNMHGAQWVCSHGKDSQSRCDKYGDHWLCKTASKNGSTITRSCGHINGIWVCRKL